MSGSQSDISKSWYELREAAEFLGVHFTTLRRWADDGVIPCFRTPGGHRRFKLADLESFTQRPEQSQSRNQPSRALQRIEEPAIADLGHFGVQDEPWYPRLDEVQLTAMRADGRQMMAVLMQYATRENGGEAFLVEGRRLAAHYGQICYAVGLSLIETVRGFTLVRRSIADSVYQTGSLSGPADSDSWRLYDRVNDFLDTMLLAIVQAFEDCGNTPA